ncbi:DUF805 domain-containing protein [Aquincola sp. J276]|uniref:DUF805 domain-containing protein n=1 Tax=Aquincola sp. J276 TaxID=2898432 RepID=UPI002151B38C|nr:DUF805 domain-containing protein [Aquincola sp. J276]MCR5868141.1 DUF805 domain-containing protein [Aquincola sp. J276]
MGVVQIFRVAGRIGRKEFWVIWMAIILAGALGGLITGLAGGNRAGVSTVEGLLLLGFYVIATWVSIAISVKRLHDTGRSGWWLAKFMVLAAAPWSCTFLAALAGGLISTWLAPALAIVGIGVGGYSWYLIGFKRGEPGVNDYGLPGSGSAC